MGPSALSVVVEQFFRVLTILIGSFVVLYVLKASVSLAVGISTFGAFMGAVGGLTVLSAYYMRRRRHLKKKKWQVYHKQRNLFSRFIRSSLHILFHLL